MPANVKDAVKEMASLADNATHSYTQLLETIGRATIRGESARIDTATDELTTLIQQTMQLADLHGRRRTLLQADAMPAPDPDEPHQVRFSVGSIAQLRRTPVVPKVDFIEAAVAMVHRDPRLARGYQDVQEAYRRDLVFTLAKKASLETVTRVRDYLAEAAAAGEDEVKAGAVIAKLGRWSEAYGRLVYRTNLATAYSAGRFQQVLEPEVQDAIPAFEYVSVRDVDARENHAAAHGLVAGVRDRIWHRFAPPMGYNCRCGLRPVGVDEARARRLLGKQGIVRVHYPATFAEAHPDQGFGRARPDLRFYKGG